MMESGDSIGSLADARLQQQRRRRILWLCCLLILVVVAAAIVLALTVFKVRDPTMELVSVRASGASPRVNFIALRVELNLTLDLAVRVHNPNYASFAHAPGGGTRLLYHGVEVGDADVTPGVIPARGSEVLQISLAVEVDRIAGKLGSLLADGRTGEVALDAETTLPGEVTILGFIKHHAVAMADCHMVLGVSDLRVRSQICKHKAKL